VTHQNKRGNPVQVGIGNTGTLSNLVRAAWDGVCVRLYPRRGHRHTAEQPHSQVADTLGCTFVEEFATPGVVNISTESQPRV
jgi:hypothetical protein